MTFITEPQNLKFMKDHYRPLIFTSRYTRRQIRSAVWFRARLMTNIACSNAFRLKIFIHFVQLQKRTSLQSWRYRNMHAENIAIHIVGNHITSTISSLAHDTPPTSRNIFLCYNQFSERVFANDHVVREDRLSPPLTDVFFTSPLHLETCVYRH